MPSGILPFDKNLGLPQKQAVKINNVAYELLYSYNSVGKFIKLKITRKHDGAIVFNSKIVELNPYEIKDPKTYETLFTILPRKLKEDVEIWVFWDEI